MLISQNYEHYTQIPRHWSAESESYTGADSLLTALERGWQIVGAIYREDVLFRGARRSAIYHFTLERNNQRAVMTVVSNPFLVRYVKQRSLSVEQTQRPMVKIPHWQEDEQARLA